MRPQHPSELGDSDRWLVPLSLLMSYLANDGEELLTMPGSVVAASWAPAPRYLRRPVPRGHARVAIGTVGLLVCVGVIDGIRTRGRGRLYQETQLAFGAHGFTHLAASMSRRGYTPGVLTAPAVVLPQWAWAHRRLRAAKVPRTASPLRAAALAFGTLHLAHALGALATSVVRRGGANGRAWPASEASTLP